MTHTVIGVFESFDRANHAADRLVASAVKRTQMDVHSRDANYVAADISPSSSASPAHAEDRSFMQKVEDFFANLFGDDDRPAEVAHYQEAVRRGSALVTVSGVEETEISMIRQELEVAGALDIDEKASEWAISNASEGVDPVFAKPVANDSNPGLAADESVAQRPALNTGTTRVYSSAGTSTGATLPSEKERNEES